MEHKFLKSGTSLYNVRYLVEYSYRNDDGSRSRKVYTLYHYNEKLNEEAKEEFIKTKGRKLKGLIVEKVKYEKITDR